MAGKKKRAEAAERRRKQKQARKTAMKAQYAAWRDQGINQKSKRVRLSEKRSGFKNRKAPRKRIKRMSSVKKADGTYMTYAQTHNTMSVKQLHKLMRAE